MGGGKVGAEECKIFVSLTIEVEVDNEVECLFFYGVACWLLIVHFVLWKNHLNSVFDSMSI